MKINFNRFRRIFIESLKKETLRPSRVAEANTSFSTNFEEIICAAWNSRAYSAKAKQWVGNLDQAPDGFAEAIGSKSQQIALANNIISGLIAGGMNPKDKSTDLRKLPKKEQVTQDWVEYGKFTSPDRPDITPKTDVISTNNEFKISVKNAGSGAQLMSGAFNETLATLQTAMNEVKLDNRKCLKQLLSEIDALNISDANKNIAMKKIAYMLFPVDKDNNEINKLIVNQRNIFNTARNLIKELRTFYNAKVSTFTKLDDNKKNDLINSIDSLLKNFEGNNSISATLIKYLKDNNTKSNQINNVIKTLSVNGFPKQLRNLKISLDKNDINNIKNYYQQVKSASLNLSDLISSTVVSNITNQTYGNVKGVTGYDVSKLSDADAGIRQNLKNTIDNFGTVLNLIFTKLPEGKELLNKFRYEAATGTVKFGENSPNTANYMLSWWNDGKCILQKVDEYLAAHGELFKFEAGFKSKSDASKTSRTTYVSTRLKANGQSFEQFTTGNKLARKRKSK